ncbi:hypothetical protein BGZ83_007994 [Gryganskiella cystojenkinii]|nr:hypothetical protein BGZ83_007994 [Gryganskiella cystojenkinii]
MRTSSISACKGFLLLCLSALLLPSFFLNSQISAQSPNCHNCIKRAIPKIGNCTALTPTQLTTLDTLLHGAKLYSNASLFRVNEPAAFDCLVSLMWDIVHYKATLWDQCLDPGVGCPWLEMMHYFTIIPRIASLYGVNDPPFALKLT